MARVNGRLARIYLSQGNFEAAAKHIAAEPVQWVRDMHAILLNSRGENSEAFRAAAVAYDEAYGVSNSFQLAELYGFVGDVDTAFQWLESALDVHDPGMSWVSASEFLRALHDDPRWPEITARAGF
jgi:hypothetical protein